MLNQYYIEKISEETLFDNPEDLELSLLDYLESIDIEIESVEYFPSQMMFKAINTDGFVKYYEVEEYENLDNEIAAMNREYDRER